MSSMSHITMGYQTIDQHEGQSIRRFFVLSGPIVLNHLDKPRHILEYQKQFILEVIYEHSEIYIHIHIHTQI